MPAFTFSLSSTKLMICEARAVADARRTNADLAALDDGAGKDGAARGAVNCERLARHRGLVHGGLAVKHHAVDGMTLPERTTITSSGVTSARGFWRSSSSSRTQTTSHFTESCSASEAIDFLRA